MYLISEAEGKILREMWSFKFFHFRVSIYLLCIHSLKSAGQCERKGTEVDCSSPRSVIWTTSDLDACYVVGNRKRRSLHKYSFCVHKQAGKEWIVFWECEVTQLDEYMHRTTNEFREANQKAMKHSGKVGILSTIHCGNREVM